MTALANHPPVFAPRFDKAITRRQANVRLRLMASGDGWSLVAPDGNLVFQALGTQGRRRCLEYAYSKGVLAVLS